MNGVRTGHQIGPEGTAEQHKTKISHKQAYWEAEAGLSDWEKVNIKTQTSFMSILKVIRDMKFPSCDNTYSIIFLIRNSFFFIIYQLITHEFHCFDNNVQDITHGVSRQIDK